MQRREFRVFLSRRKLFCFNLVAVRHGTRARMSENERNCPA